MLQYYPTEPSFSAFFLFPQLSEKRSGIIAVIGGLSILVLAEHFVGGVLKIRVGFCGFFGAPSRKDGQLDRVAFLSVPEQRFGRMEHLAVQLDHRDIFFKSVDDDLQSSHLVTNLHRRTGFVNKRTCVLLKIVYNWGKRLQRKYV